MFRAIYQEGVKTAAGQMGIDPHTLMELGGLGLIAAPVAHSIIAGEEHEHPAITKIKHLSDLAGLGLLAAPSIQKLMKR